MMPSPMMRLQPRRQPRRRPMIGCAMTISQCPITAHGALGCSPPPPRVPRRHACPCLDALCASRARVSGTDGAATAPAVAAPPPDARAAAAAAVAASSLSLPPPAPPRMPLALTRALCSGRARVCHRRSSDRASGRCSAPPSRAPRAPCRRRRRRPLLALFPSVWCVVRACAHAQRTAASPPLTRAPAPPPPPPLPPKARP